MSRLKDMGFLILIILVAVSGMYEVVQAAQIEDPDGAKRPMFPITKNASGVSYIAEFESSVLYTDVNAFGASISIDNLVQSTIALDLTGLLSSLLTGLGLIWGLFTKMMAWTNLVEAIFASVGLADLSMLFIGPLAIIQIIAGFYLFRDIVNTVRGVR